METQELQNLDELLVSDNVTAHKVCKSNVETPTIVFGERTFEDGKTSGVYFQWFGVVNRIPTQKQFLFPISMGIDNSMWMGHPEEFKIVFIDQVKNWPSPEMARRVANVATDGDLEASIIWACGHHYHQQYPEGIGPASFLIPIALLGDPNVGVISPGTFCNMELKECPECKR
jgi:hypothetical protein